MEMTQKKLFSEFGIDENQFRSIWSSNDDWNSVEIYRLMKGCLPQPDDMSLKYALEFLRTSPSVEGYHFIGDPYMTAKKMIYRYSDYFLQELNGVEPKDLK